jgi:hypothetical protein
MKRAASPHRCFNGLRLWGAQQAYAPGVLVRTTCRHGEFIVIKVVGEGNKRRNLAYAYMVEQAT